MTAETALAALEAAREALEVAACDLIRKRCDELSRRFPSRLIQYQSGNGSRNLAVSRRRPIKSGDNTGERESFIDSGPGRWDNWPSYVERSTLMAELEEMEDAANINWLGAMQYEVRGAPPEPEEPEAAAKLDAFISTHGLTFAFAFVPYSVAKAKRADWSNGPGGKPWEGLTWAVTIAKGGRPFIVTDYSAGTAHAPAYKAKPLGGVPKFRDRYIEALRAKAISAECETGVVHDFGEGVLTDNSGLRKTRRPVPTPTPRDVLWSLGQDASVLDSGGFEDWAADLGYDTDSRKAEETYKACMEIALKLRAALGDAGLSALREAGQDY